MGSARDSPLLAFNLVVAGVADDVGLLYVSAARAHENECNRCLCYYYIENERARSVHSRYAQITVHGTIPRWVATLYANR